MPNGFASKVSGRTWVGQYHLAVAGGWMINMRNSYWFWVRTDDPPATARWYWPDPTVIF